MANIIIEGAREGNLKDVSLEIPRDRLNVFTGLSGSGKTTLAMDVIFQECQRQYLEAIGLQGIRKPKVDSVRNLSPAILISQTETNRNTRSTVGTVTDIYTDLRMVYEKLAVRDCPNCRATISAADCREETERRGDDFKVFMYCHVCNVRMDKLTRTNFSHNTREGACPKCAGLGKVLSIDRERVVDESRSLEGGAVDFWEQKYKDYMIENLYSAFRHYGVPVAPGTPVARFSDEQKAILYEGVESAAVRRAFPDVPTPRTVSGGRFEGILPLLWRRMADKGGESKQLGDYFMDEVCPECGGERLAPLSRRVTVAGTRLPELTVLSLDELLAWVQDLDRSLAGRSARAGRDAAVQPPAGESALHEAGPGAGHRPQMDHRALVAPYLVDLMTKIQRLARVGLGYLSLDRQTMTLSGGELQRVKLAAALDSDLTGVIYIMDEPTIGLHPQDTEGMIAILKRLRDAGNTVIVIEHDPDVMQAADHIIDIGPGAGRHGGQVIGAGTLDELKQQPGSVTGQYFAAQAAGSRHAGAMDEAGEFGEFRAARQSRTASAYQSSQTAPETDSDAIAFIEINHASRHNLRDIEARFPIGCLTAVTGVSGSGKSTLVFDVLAAAADKAGGRARDGADVSGLAAFNQVVAIEQSAIARMKRSNVATFSDAYTGIRALFGSLPAAKAHGLTARHFSFNTPGGRCENCEGLGFVTSNMLFFQDIEVTCPVCGGRQFNEDVLSVLYEGHSIKDVLQLSVEEAGDLFHRHARIERILRLLQDVGLGYLELGQSLTTLSGGEAQRLKLARELIGNTGRRSLYLMDEPTTGLHPVDVVSFLALLDRMVDAGNTVIVVEHNQQVIRAADWIIDLGPGGGIRGGQVVFTGTPLDMIAHGETATAAFLRKTYGGE